MSNEKCGRLILDTIDQLRKRKARPDFDRIIHMIERRHGLKGPAVTDELARLISEGTVVKVDYKGNTSYRNAAKWGKTKSQFFGSVYSSSDISPIVLEAVSALTSPSEGQQAMKSASIQDIEQYLLRRDSQSNLNQATLRAVLEKEVVKRTIHQLPSGEFVANKPATTENNSKKTEDDKKNNTSPPPLKRIKSEVNSTKNSSENVQFYCNYCLLPSGSIKKGQAEKLVICKDCHSKAHPSCMGYSKSLIDVLSNREKWSCPECKLCSICNDPMSAETMVICYECYKCYHMKCQTPSLSDKPSGAWYCFDCNKNSKENLNLSQVNDSTGNTSEDEIIFEKHVTVSSYKEEFRKSIEKYPKQIPFAKKWTIENVETFFKHIGFEEEAGAFREQEIDGLSLLLMKRNDVLTGLGIKLGPALKIHKHVRNLQSLVNN